MPAITRYLKLDPKQTAKLQAWMETIPKLTMAEAEEDVSLAGREFTFGCYGTGLGDVLYVETIVQRGFTGYKMTCHLGYDDDGELIP